MSDQNRKATDLACGAMRTSALLHHRAALSARGCICRPLGFPSRADAAQNFRVLHPGHNRACLSRGNPSR